jgi:copper chaperone CopZ
MESVLEKKELFITGMTCEGCARTVKKKLESIDGVKNSIVYLEKNIAELEINLPETSLNSIAEKFNSIQKNYTASFTKQKEKSFWGNFLTWKEAGKNTLNCLIGCSIGDFGMMIYLQNYHPNFPVVYGMILAMITGLTTSIIFETILLKLRNGFSFSESLKTAFSMSFLSMLGMELAENITDYSLTGGMVPTTHHFYWVALAISMLAGFVVPLPYNYYKLEKFGKACH